MKIINLLKPYLAIIFFTLTSPAWSQSLGWQEDIQLELTNFKSDQTKIDPSRNSVFIQSGARIDFSFYMSAYEFMFTKNFNSKVKTVFEEDLAVFTAPDSTHANYLLNYARYDFDIHELYARKFRQALYEQKDAFSDVSFFQPIYQKLQREMISENSRVLNESQFGSDTDFIKSEHQKVRIQIQELKNFCKDCKPPKLKKSESD